MAISHQQPGRTSVPPSTVTAIVAACAVPLGLAAAVGLLTIAMVPGS